jgi:hypothetical protein
MSIRILIADDHTMFADMLQATLVNQRERYAVVGIAGDGGQEKGGGCDAGSVAGRGLCTEKQRQARQKAIHQHCQSCPICPHFRHIAPPDHSHLQGKYGIGGCLRLVPTHTGSDEGVGGGAPMVRHG